MKYLPMIWAGLMRRKVRTILTLVSILVAFILFGLLDTVRHTFANTGQTVAGRDRLLTASKMHFGKPIPFSLLSQIQKIPGVVNVEYASSLFGTYQDPKTPAYAEPHADTFLDLYPELELAPAEHQALLRTRTGAIAGEALVKKYNLKIGDKFPIKSSTLRKDGSDLWTFDIVGIYRFTDPNMKLYETILYTNWDYFDEARASDNGTVGWYAIKVADPAEMGRISRDIDALSANSDHETKTQSENAFSAAWFNQVGDLGLIVTSVMGAVFFTLVLLTGHAIAQGVSERTAEFGVLKSIGFTGRSIMGLVLSESIVLLLLGSAIGVGVATLGVIILGSVPGVVLPIPMVPMGAAVWLRGLAFAAAIGVIVGALPALRALRLRTVDALSGR